MSLQTILSQESRSPRERYAICLQGIRLTINGPIQSQTKHGLSPIPTPSTSQVGMILPGTPPMAEDTFLSGLQRIIIGVDVAIALNRLTRHPGLAFVTGRIL